MDDSRRRQQEEFNLFLVQSNPRAFIALDGGARVNSEERITGFLLIGGRVEDVWRWGITFFTVFTTTPDCTVVTKKYTLMSIQLTEYKEWK